MAKRLAGTKASHAAKRDAAMAAAEHQRSVALKAVDRGSCTSAYLAINEMNRKIGESNAHGREVGRTAWFDQTNAQELGYEFSTKCLRDKPALEGARKRRR